MTESSDSSNATKAAVSNVVEMPQPDASASAPSPSTSTTDSDSPAASASPAQPAADRPEERGGSGKMALILGLLLAGSVGLNFIQSQGRSSLEAQAAEYSEALERSIVRLDEETLRATNAENKLDAIDGSVVTVNERIADLQKALNELTEITAR